MLILKLVRDMRGEVEIPIATRTMKTITTTPTIIPTFLAELMPDLGAGYDAGCGCW